MKSDTLEVLHHSIPADTDPGVVERWADKLVPFMLETDFMDLPRARFDTIAYHDLETEKDRQRFINLALLSDWACYAPPECSLADRCSYERMDRSVRNFPDGFRLTVCILNDQRLLPVGYTGWYPIDRATFDRLYYEPQTLTNRGQVVPLEALQDEANCVYIFNFSIVPSLRGSAQGKALLEALHADLNKIELAGLVDVTVSEDGQRVSQRFGMSYRGYITHDGETEGVFAVKFDPPVRGFKLRPKQMIKHSESASGS